ncbi:MAG TPA: SOS response-associated peptidase family protein [Croceibacterium sp.]|jgi:putative SOS response-associated peptidase YedK
MCNLYRMERAPDAIVGLARELGIAVDFPEGVPNFQPRDVRITERAPILRASSADSARLELVERRWSWPAPNGKPVFNFRGEGRRFDPAERCVVLADGFYEFTAPDDAKAKKKDRWLFTWPGHEWFGIAGLQRSEAPVGEAFTMLTCPPGPDVEPYHNRQVVLLSPADCFAWLDPAEAAERFVQPLPMGSLAVARA